MANIDENFVVKTGLTVGPTTITASTGNVQVGGTVINGTTGDITVGSTVINGTTGAITTNANVTTQSNFIVGSTVLSPSGAVSTSNIIATGGTLNNVAIGGSTASSAYFTTMDATGTVTTNDILPHVTNVSNIGSATQRFQTIFVNEARLSVNTLFLGDTPILGTSNNVINIHADSGQAIHMQTSGAAGTLSFVANAQVTMQTTGNNADVLIQSNGTGSKTRFLSGTEAVITAPTITLTGNVTTSGGGTVTGDLTVNGNLTVGGTQTVVNATNLAVKDNVIVVNSGELGNGVSSGTAGIQFDRGALSDYQLVFQESDDTLQFGAIGSTETVATRTWTGTQYALAADVSATAGVVNRIVKADASGYINNSYFSSTDNSAGSGVTAVMVKAGDNVLRSGTASSISTFLGLANSATIASTSLNTASTIVSRDASGNFAAGVITATSTNARYADLAENYSADAEYAPGTVVEFGGDAEVTLGSDGTRKVAGVVTTYPAYLMNVDLAGVKAAVALQGRVPCKVKGKVSKGDMLVSAGGGYARAEADPKMGQVIGKSLDSFDGAEGVIEVVVGRM